MCVYDGPIIMTGADTSDENTAILGVVHGVPVRQGAYSSGLGPSVGKRAFLSWLYDGGRCSKLR